MIYPYSEKSEVLNADNAVGYLLASAEHHDIVELHIHTGGQVPAHQIPIDVAFYVVSGKGQLSIADLHHEASEGDVLEVKKGLDRAWTNTSSEILKLLVIKQKSQVD